MKTKKSEFVVIPMEIVTNNKVPGNAKILYGEIFYECEKKGWCTTGSSDFAKKFKVRHTTIDGWIKKLEQAELIGVQKRDLSTQSNRIIYLKDPSMAV